MPDNRESCELPIYLLTILVCLVVTRTGSITCSLCPFHVTTSDVAWSKIEVGFPGGNAGILRHIVKHLLPESIEGGRSFEGFGNFFAIRRRMQTGKPTVMTFYVPFNNPGLPAKDQGGK
jgi:hypothetical protein